MFLMIKKLGHDDLQFLNIVPMFIHMKTLDLSFWTSRDYKHHYDDVAMELEYLICCQLF